MTRRHLLSAAIGMPLSTAKPTDPYGSFAAWWADMPLAGKAFYQRKWAAERSEQPNHWRNRIEGGR